MAHRIPTYTSSSPSSSFASSSSFSLFVFPPAVAGSFPSSVLLKGIEPPVDSSSDPSSTGTKHNGQVKEMAEREGDRLTRHGPKRSVAEQSRKQCGDLSASVSADRVMEGVGMIGSPWRVIHSIIECWRGDARRLESGRVQYAHQRYTCSGSKLLVTLTALAISRISVPMPESPTRPPHLLFKSLSRSLLFGYPSSFRSCTDHSA